MRTGLVLIACLLATGGCREDVEIPDGFCALVDLKSPPPEDLTPPPPKCGAATGLPGTNLACVDFSQVSGLSDPKLANWYFQPMDVNCPGWTINAGSLQVTGFSGFMGNCQFKLPPLSAADYQKYKSFALSVTQTVDIDESKQKVQVMLGINDPSTRLVDQTTGKQPRKQWVNTIAKTALPNGGTNAYQPLLMITSGITIGLNGWQVESVAINGIE